MILTKKETDDLLDYLLELGIPKSDVVCVYLEGSYLYVREPRDIDLMCITRSEPPIHCAPEQNVFYLRGFKVDANLISVSEFETRISDVFPNHFYHEEEDWELIYGDKGAVKPHPLTLRRFHEEMESFKTILFDKQSPIYEPKRLASFFILARKLGERVPDGVIEEAHRGKLDPERFRWLFDILFTQSIPFVYPQK